MYCNNSNSKYIHATYSHKEKKETIQHVAITVIPFRAKCTIILFADHILLCT